MSTTIKESHSFGGSRLAFGRAIRINHHEWSLGMLSHYWLTFELETSLWDGCQRPRRSPTRLGDLVWRLAGPFEFIITNDPLVCYLFIGWLLSWREAFEMDVNECEGVPLIWWISFGLWQGHPSIITNDPLESYFIFDLFSRWWQAVTKNVNVCKGVPLIGWSRLAFGRAVRVYHHKWSLGMLFFFRFIFEVMASCYKECQRVWRSPTHSMDLVGPLAGLSGYIITNDPMAVDLDIGWVLSLRQAFEMCTNEWLGVPLSWWISFGLWQGHPSISSQKIPWYANLFLADFLDDGKLLQ